MTVPALRRDDFPVLERFCYLNTAAVGLVPTSVLEPVQRLESELAQAGTTAVGESAEDVIFDAVRAGAAALFNADPASIALCTSCTEALCQVAWWLKPGNGRNVVSSEVDFPSVTYPWHRIAAETGCEVRLVPVLDDPEGFDVDRIAAHVDSATAAICISHVQYLTGHVLDLCDLATLAHDNGALLVVDATQSAGQLPIDVTAAGVDVLMASGYKWLCSMIGAAVCYVSPSLLPAFSPPFVGWRSTEHPYTLDARWRPLAASARRMEYSTRPYALAEALSRGIDYVASLSPARIAQHNGRLADQLYAGLAERGARLLTPHDKRRRAGSVTARFPDHDGADIAGQLARRGVIAATRVGSTRFAMHLFNSSDDVERALRSLDEVLR
jgi:selenocysteine lyase/cysteine desulfurase